MTNLSIDARTTVNDVVLAYPQTVSVFKTFGIDACCGGAKSLDEAARRHGVDLDALLHALYSITSPACECETGAA